MYKTKTQKKNALRSIRGKAMKLFATGTITMKDAENIAKICDFRMGKL